MGVYSGTPRTWVSGETVTAALMNSDTRDPIKALADASTSYTPTWTGASTNPAIGNGTISAAYTRVNKFITFHINITMGSTTTYGTGQWRLTLPVSAVAIPWVFPTVLRDVGTGTYSSAAAVYDSSGPYLALYAPATTAGAIDRVVTGTVPFTWANTDTLTISGTYEAA